jgi:IS4 transposase
VIRLHYDRRVLVGAVKDKLSAMLAEAAVRVVRTVRISRRKKAEKGEASKRNAPREEREATLELRTTTVTLLRPGRASSPDPFLTVNIVHVVEVDTPPGQERVEWMLATTLPIDSVEDVEFIVDSYRARWVIEEWFRALKTGCA